VKLIRPRDESDTFRNPIGVYVTNFTWGREFTGPVQREETTPSSANPTSSAPAGASAATSVEPIHATTQQGAKP
jgi:hypothetical protein